MRMQKFGIGSLIAVCALVTACDKKTGVSPYNRVDPHSVIKKSQSPSERAEILARSAEEMFWANPLAFMYVNEILSLALEQDSKNVRANFYRKFLAPSLAMKGIVARIKPIATQIRPEKYEFHVNEIKTRFPKDLTDFLLNGPEDIRNEREAQAFIDGQEAAYDDYRQFIKANKKSNLVLNMTLTQVLAQIQDPMLCDAKKLDDGSFEYRDCTLAERTQVLISSADAEALQHHIAGLQVFTILMNSRDVTGAIAAARKYIGAETHNELVYSDLEKNKEFGVIRNQKALSRITAMGLDGVAGAQYFVANQKELCPIDYSTDSTWEYDSNTGNYTFIEGKEIPTRPGKLFDSGICIHDSSPEEIDWTNRIIAVVNAGLRGEVVKLKYSSWDQRDGSPLRKEVSVRPLLALTKPIADLKVLKPTFNGCGEVVSIADDTFGGVIVKGSANNYLESKGSDCFMYPNTEVQGERNSEEKK